MAILHRTTLEPSKPEVLRAWIPTQPWHDGSDPSDFEIVGAYRFDDPDGEVGIETHLVRTSTGAVLQVPLTYRAAPRKGVEPVARMQHGVLGERWVYDGCADPVCVRAFVTAIRAGGRQAAFEYPDGTTREATTLVRGTGTDPHADVEGFDVDVRRVLSLSVEDAPHGEGEVLTGTWPGQAEPTLLASLRSA